MKIFSFILLLFLILCVEKRYAEMFYIASSNLSYYIRTVKSQNKPVILKQFDRYLAKIDSTINELEGFQRRCLCIDKYNTKLYKPDRTLVSKARPCYWKVFKLIYRQIRKRIYYIVTG